MHAASLSGSSSITGAQCYSHTEHDPTQCMHCFSKCVRWVSGHCRNFSSASSVHPARDLGLVCTVSEKSPLNFSEDKFSVSEQTLKLVKRCEHHEPVLVELVGYLENAAGPVPLVLDLRIAHDRFGSSSDPILNDQLHYPRGYFHFRRAGFSSILKSKCDNILTKTAVLRINLILT